MKPQPRLYGRPLHSGIPNVKQESYDWEHPPTLIDRRTERPFRNVTASPSWMKEDSWWSESEPEPPEDFKYLFVVYRLFLGAMCLVGLGVGFFFYRIGPFLHRLLVMVGL